MAGTTQRVAPDGARLAASTRQNAWLTPEEIAAARQAKERVDSPSIPTPAPAEPVPSLPIAAATAPTFAAAPAVPAVTTGLPAAVPAILSAHVIAEMCTAAEVPELIVSMLQSPMTLGQVEDRLENARLILQCGNLIGRPEMGRQLMAAGVPVATARQLICDAEARADAAIVTDPTHSGGAAPVSSGRINSAAVYTRLNKMMTPQNRKD